MGAKIKLKSKADGFEFGAYHAPAQGGRKGGIVLIQEAFGVTAGIRQLCDRFAADGYEVIAPQMFDRFERDFEVDRPKADFSTIRTWMEESFPLATADVQACINSMSPPVFITGFCYGGTVTWLAAARCTGLKAAAAFYGGGIATKFLDETPKIPIILHFGERDPHIGPDALEAIRKAHPDVPLYTYDADHGFFSEDRPDYSKEVAAVARQRTLELFSKAAKA